MDQEYQVTPKGIAMLALCASGILDVSAFGNGMCNELMEKFEAFWNKFEELMFENGYLEYE